MVSYPVPATPHRTAVDSNAERCRRSPSRGIGPRPTTIGHAARIRSCRPCTGLDASSGLPDSEEFVQALTDEPAAFDEKRLVRIHLKESAVCGDALRPERLTT